jgi:hypothetical protein
MSSPPQNSNEENKQKEKADLEPKPHIPRLPAGEEEALVAESNAIKSNANQLFTSSSYDAAITGYHRALNTLPSYLDYEIAILRSNIAACYVKLAEWKTAVDEADQGLECLETVEKEVAELDQTQPVSKIVELEDDDVVEEGPISQVAENKRLPQKDDIFRIRTKLLLRRAKARTEIGGWAALQGAQEGRFDASTLGVSQLMVGQQTTRSSPRFLISAL